MVTIRNNLISNWYKKFYQKFKNELGIGLKGYGHYIQPCREQSCIRDLRD